MTVRHETIQSQSAGWTPRDLPQPISLETVAVIEQAFAQLLNGLRERMAEPAADGTAEYESWLPKRH